MTEEKYNKEYIKGINSNENELKSEGEVTSNMGVI